MLRVDGPAFARARREGTLLTLVVIPALFLTSYAIRARFFTKKKP